MHTVIVKPLFHRHAEQIGIVFKKNQQINDVVKKIKEVKWSQTHSCWYVPLSKEAWVGLQNGLKAFMVDSTELKAYLEKRNIVKTSFAGSGEEKKAPLPPQSPVWKLCKENLRAVCLLNCGWTLSIQLKITILFLWLIETDVFQMPQLHKHFNVVRNRQHTNHYNF